MALTFEWDDAKAGANARKHGSLGVTKRGRLVVVAHTERGDTIRLISARLATAKERNGYEEGTRHRAR